MYSINNPTSFMEFAKETQALLFFSRRQRKTNFRFVIQLWKLDVTD
jgi:hypothetical protein